MISRVCPTLPIFACLLLASALAACSVTMGAPPYPPPETTPDAGTTDGDATDPGTTDGDATDAGSTDGVATDPGSTVHWILVGQASNARDLGGTPLAAGATVAYGKVFRGGPLSGLGPNGCAELAFLGIRTIVDLRTSTEAAYAPDAVCATSLAPVVYAPMPIPYYVSPTDYVADLDATASVAAAFAVLADDTASPAYFHCTYGRDRTGVLTAVILLALGATRATIIDEYQLTATAGLTTYPTSLEAVIDEITRRGGIEAYLASAGVTPAAIAAVRARLFAASP
jgi:protein-tyrosine phosphatase